MSYSDRGLEVSINMNNLNLSHKQEDRNREVYIPPRVRGDFWRKCQSLQYKSDKCRLQTADTPYYVALSTRIFGTQAQELGDGEE